MTAGVVAVILAVVSLAVTWFLIRAVRTLLGRWREDSAQPGSS